MTHLAPTRIVELSARGAMPTAEESGHLSQCVRCRESLDSECELTAFIGLALRPAKVPVDFTARTTERFARGATRKRLRTTSLVFLGLCLASVAVTGLSLAAVMLNAASIVDLVCVGLAQALMLAKVAAAVLAHVPFVSQMLAASSCAAALLWSMVLTQVVGRSDVSRS